MSSFTPSGAGTVVDSILFRNAFGTAKMREIFSDRSLIRRCIDAEVALARAEARVGVVPTEAAEVIARESRFDRLDLDHMRHETDIVGYPARFRICRFMTRGMDSRSVGTPDPFRTATCPLQVAPDGPGVRATFISQHTIAK